MTADSATLVWFRQDLRTRDHEPLVEASRSASRIIPVYVLDDRELSRTDQLEEPRLGPFRARFLTEAIADLRRGLRELGSDLVIRRGDPVQALETIAREHRVDTIRFHRLVGTEEQDLERRVRDELGRPGVRIEGSWGHTLVRREDLPFPVERTPEVFTEFRKRVEAETTWFPPLPSPARLPPLPAGIDVGSVPTLASLAVDEPIDDPRAVLRFVGGEKAGLDRLQSYFWSQDRLRRYKDTRNGMVGADYSSKLSPWLALGCLSPRSVREEVARYEAERVANLSTYWLVFELLWRDYFHFILAKHGRRLFRSSGLQGLRIPWKRDRGLFERWRLGVTGYPIVDANLRELLHSGFLSNRGRQIVASFLTKNLGIDWRWGAEWFESQLVDHDVASNHGNWNYVAGVGNDARGFRYFDLVTQAEKYDRRGDHAKLWIPELADVPGEEVHRVWQGAAVTGYPAPVVDLDESVRRLRSEWEAAVGVGR